MQQNDRQLASDILNQTQAVLRRWRTRAAGPSSVQGSALHSTTATPGGPPENAPAQKGAHETERASPTRAPKSESADRELADPVNRPRPGHADRVSCLPGQLGPRFGGPLFL